MIRYLQLFAVVLVHWLSPIESVAQESVALSLNEAVGLAVKNNADITVARHNATSAEYGVRESKGNFLPKLNLIGNYTRNIDKPVIFLPQEFGLGGATEIGANNNFNTYLDLSVPLYSKYNITARNYAQSHLYWQQENLRGTQKAVIAEVKKAYLACLLAVEAVRVRERALANAEQNHSDILYRVDQGTATEYDGTAAKVRASNFRIDLLEAQAQIIPVENNLRLLLGLSPQTGLTLTDSLYLTGEELTISSIDTGLLNNSSLRQKELMMQVAAQQTAMARSSYFPVLSGNGVYQYQSQQNNFHFPDYNWVLSSSLGLRLQVPIFNGTITRNKIQQAIISENIAKTQKDQVSRFNDAKFAQLISTLAYLRQRITAQADNIVLAARAVELIKERYRYGKANLLEVNSAELDYITARLNYLQSVVDYKSTYCDLELITGKLKAGNFYGPQPAHYA